MNCRDYVPTHFDEILHSKKHSIFLSDMTFSPNLSRKLAADPSAVGINVSDYKLQVYVSFDDRNIDYVFKRKENMASSYVDISSPTYTWSSWDPALSSSSSLSWVIPEKFSPIRISPLEDSYSKSDWHTYSTEKEGLEWLWEEFKKLEDTTNTLIDIPFVLEESIANQVVTREFVRKVALKIVNGCTDTKTQSEAFTLLTYISSNAGDDIYGTSRFLPRNFFKFLQTEVPTIARGILKTIVYEDSYKAILFKQLAEQSISTLRL